jgi:hypothetical protein
MKSNSWAADRAFSLVFCGGYDRHPSRLSEINASRLANGYNCKTDLELGWIMKAWITVLKAADTAASWHVHQRRKGKHEEP